jgi:hypothetical protein
VLKDFVEVAAKEVEVVAEEIGDDGMEEIGRNGVPDDMPISTAQLLDQPIQQEDETTAKTPVQLWLESKTEHPWKSFNKELSTMIVEHVTHHISSEYDPIWMKEVRGFIWRAVVRSNYWWVNPEEGKWTGRQKPVEVNEGVWSGSFEAWVDCCARRQDRVGRDIATHEYVHKVEDDVREFLFRAERSGMHSQLEHLAFLLMFDETKRHAHVMELQEMQERIAIAFTDAGGKMNWKGLSYMRAAGKKPAMAFGMNPGIGENVWQTALAEL